MNFIKKKEIIEDSKPLKEHKFKWLPYKISFWFLVIALSTYGVYSFINTHDFRTPILFQNPIPLKEINIISPLGTPSAKIVVENPDIHKIVRAIYGLESTWGRNDSCRQYGKWNGYGFGQNSSSNNCFDSFETVTTKVTNWVQDKIDKEWSVAQTLCYYNLGIQGLEDCDYYKDYLSLCK